MTQPPLDSALDPQHNLACVCAKCAPPHSPICPQHGLLCVCAKCYSPPCLCAIVAAVEDGDRDGLRLAFWDAAKAVES